MEILITVGIFIIGVLGFLSYHHYESYEKIAYKLMGGLMVILVILTVWSSSMYHLAITTKQSIRDTRTSIDSVLSINRTYSDSIFIKYSLEMEKELLANKAYDKLKSYTIEPITVLPTYVIANIILFLLIYSPNIIKDHPHNKQKQK